MKTFFPLFSLSTLALLISACGITKNMDDMNASTVKMSGSTEKMSGTTAKMSDTTDKLLGTSEAMSGKIGMI